MGCPITLRRLTAEVDAGLPALGTWRPAIGRLGPALARCGPALAAKVLPDPVQERGVALCRVQLPPRSVALLRRGALACGEAPAVAGSRGWIAHRLIA